MSWRPVILASVMVLAACTHTVRVRPEEVRLECENGQYCLLPERVHGMVWSQVSVASADGTVRQLDAGDATPDLLLTPDARCLEFSRQTRRRFWVPVGAAAGVGAVGALVAGNELHQRNGGATFGDCFAVAGFLCLIPVFVVAAAGAMGGGLLGAGVGSLSAMAAGPEDSPGQDCSMPAATPR